MKEALRPKEQAEDLSPDVTQRRASQPDTSVWVNASAGSGKTTVLTKRVLRLLLSGVRPERILCLTYTRAAAAEMAIRVTESLSLWATCDEDALRDSIKNLQKADPTKEQIKEARRLFARVLGCPGGMRIRTIHAFCQEILRRFPIEAGLPPHFTVIEENDAHALQSDIQADMLREAGDNPNSQIAQALKTLINNLGELGFGNSMQALLTDRARLRNAVEREGGVEKLIGHVRSYLVLAADETVQSITRRAVEDSAFDIAALRQAALWLTEGTKTYVKRGNDMLGWFALSAEERIKQFDEYYFCFFNKDHQRFKDMANKDLLAKYPQLQTVFDQEVTRLGRVHERLEAARIAESTASILICGLDLIRRYETKKASQAALEYEDLIVRTDELLRRPAIAPWILFKLDGGIDHILVDEAQDTSRAQWNIVAALADEFFTGSGTRDDVERTLFVVGDEKQSIFSFQRADPEAFAAMRHYFAQKINDAEKLYDEVPLQISFRSAPAVLQAVDAVFANDAVRSGVSAENVRHFASRPRPGDDPKIGRVEVWRLEEAKKDSGDKEDWTPSRYEAEHDPEAELASKIAGKIKGWLKDRIVLPGTAAPVKAGDIMILLRKRGRFADLMVRALKQHDVPVTGVDRMCLVKQLPVMDLLALMQFALLPEDDLNLATVLRGPLLNISEGQLMDLAIGRDGNLWQSLCDKAGNDAAFKVAEDYLRQWLADADFQPPLMMLTKILNEPCPGSAVSGRYAIWSRLGPDALDPVEELLNAAQNFSHRHTPSLQTFLHWLIATEAEIKRELNRRDNDSDSGQVRIMTVHASKGLEAPIVFLPDAGTAPDARYIARLLWTEKDLPIYLSSKPMRGNAVQLRQREWQKQLEEHRRLMYVALTRAASHLYIAGWAYPKKQPNEEHSWYNMIRDGLKPLDQPSARPDDDAIEIALADPVLKANPAAIPERKSAAKTPMPDWALTPASDEQSLRRLSPSRFALAPATATPDSVFHRGRIIHRLLQSLPDVSDDQRDAVASAFLSDPQHDLTAEEQNEVKREVLTILRHPDFAPLFGPGSRAEVPVVGRIAGREIPGQVDRLCVLENEVWIVDYKTNRPPPKNAESIPEAYRLQLADYRAVLKEIYPDKAIRCFLLWTYSASLMPVPEALLAP